MKNDIHLVYSETRLPEGVDHQAICKKIVKNAKQGFIWDEQAMCQEVNVGPRGICKDCFYTLPPKGGIYYVYGFKEGEPHE